MDAVPQTGGRDWRAILVGTPLGWVLALAIAALGLYLVVNRSGHLLSALPYLVLLVFFYNLWLRFASGVFGQRFATRSSAASAE